MSSHNQTPQDTRHINGDPRPIPKDTQYYANHPEEMSINGRAIQNTQCPTARNSGDKNGQWKGDDVGYTALHAWVKTRLNKPDACNSCDEVKPLDLANISQEYKRELSDWEWLCRKCHMTKDGRLDAIHTKQGMNKPQAKLTDDIVREIRIQKTAGVTNVALSRLYGVSEGLISAVYYRRKWKHVE